MFRNFALARSDKDIWTSLRYTIETCFQSVADPHLCLEVTPDLQEALRDHMEECLYQWEALADRTRQNIEPSYLWAFNRLGNALWRMVRVCHRDVNLPENLSLAEELHLQLAQAKELMTFVDPYKIWSTSVSLVSPTFRYPHVIGGHDGASLLPSKIPGFWNGIYRSAPSFVSDDETEEIDHCTAEEEKQFWRKCISVYKLLKRYSRALKDHNSSIEVNPKLLERVAAVFEGLLRQVEELLEYLEKLPSRSLFVLLNQASNSIRLCAVVAKHPPADDSASVTIYEHTLKSLRCFEKLLDAHRHSSHTARDSD